MMQTIRLIFPLPLFAALAAVLLLTGPSLTGYPGALAQAQEEEAEDKKAPMKGRKTQALGKQVYTLITDANEKVDAEDYAGARALIEKAKGLPKLTAYETAQIYSFSGFLNFNQDRYNPALRDYEKVLAQPDLPEGLLQQTYKTIAQLLFATEQYSKAIERAREYMNVAGEDPDMYALIATGYYQLDQTNRIIQPIEKAIALARERGTKPKEQWYLLQRVAYWEKEDYRKVRSILEILVTNWPKKEYWSQLSGIYYELKDESRQLAAYEAAYDQGLLETSSELTQMAQLFMQSEVPFKGAQVLEEGLASGKIEKNERNLRLLSQAWQMAQEDRKAIEPLQQAAKLSNDGDLYARLATSYLNLDQYKNCISASRNAINKGGLKYPGDTWLVLGMCQFENKQLSAAKTSFQNAAKYDKSAKNARSWITYTENEQARLQQLQESLNQLNEARQRAAERADS